VVDGIRFASKREAARYGELRLLERGGRIKNLQVHPPFILQEKFIRPDGRKVPAIRYIGDFSYWEAGVFVVEDVKGVETVVWKLKQKMFWKRYPEIDLRIVK